jgi:hypothetical protein
MRSSNPRYDGKPLVRLLECYVLEAIGHLGADERRPLIAMAPNLASTFGFAGEWHEILQQRLELPADLPQFLKEAWQRDSARAFERRLELTPQRFAEMFVDSNFGA